VDAKLLGAVVVGHKHRLERVDELRIGDVLFMHTKDALHHHHLAIFDGLIAKDVLGVQAPVFTLPDVHHQHRPHLLSLLWAIHKGICLGALITMMSRWRRSSSSQLLLGLFSLMVFGWSSMINGRGRPHHHHGGTRGSDGVATAARGEANKVLFERK
jgi:hypothetical protein